MKLNIKIATATGATYETTTDAPPPVLGENAPPVFMHNTTLQQAITQAISSHQAEKITAIAVEVVG